MNGREQRAGRWPKTGPWLALLLIVLGGCQYMTIDTTSPNPKLPPYPVTMFPAGHS